MDNFDDLPITTQIELYYEKHHAIRYGDMMTLVRMKKNYPKLFEKKNDNQIRKWIEYFKKLGQSEYYKDWLREKMKNNLFIIDTDIIDE